MVAAAYIFHELTGDMLVTWLSVTFAVRRSLQTDGATVEHITRWRRRPVVSSPFSPVSMVAGDTLTLNWKITSWRTDRLTGPASGMLE